MQKLSIVKKESLGNPGKKDGAGRASEKDGAGIAAEKDGAGDKKAKTGEVSTLKKRSVAFVPTGHTMDIKGIDRSFELRGESRLI